ncbi:hypothetical protein [Evansella halocellulosilytica]|uniref:hypothetical protein n=1 Tax=Evansella halocellulosilytica TaxID=2011013 RepID=UPI0011552AE9|nr:hypothetical protein [Evansella halocellulosilytica]
MEGILCFFLCKINRRRECVEAARREFSEETLVAPAVTRRRLCASSSTRLIEEENASKQLVENSAKKHSLLLRLLVAIKIIPWSIVKVDSYVCRLKPDFHPLMPTLFFHLGI